MAWKEQVPRDGGKTEGRVLETDVESRQGPKGRPVLLVLLGSGVLLGLYLIGMLVWTFVSTPDVPEGTALPDASVTGDINTRDPNQTAIPPANPAYPAPTAN